MTDEYDSRLIGPAQASAFRSSDQIHEDVVELIRMNDVIHPKDIDVSVENGIVTLRGRVDSEAAVNEAGQVAREVIGVTKVRNELEAAA